MSSSCHRYGHDLCTTCHGQQHSIKLQYEHCRDWSTEQWEKVQSHWLVSWASREKEGFVQVSIFFILWFCGPHASPSIVSNLSPEPGLNICHSVSWFHKAGGVVRTCMETMMQLVCKAGYSKEVTGIIATDLRRSTACLYQVKWSGFHHGCPGSNVTLCKATVQQIAEFFLYLQELGLSVPAIKSCKAAHNHVFTLSGMDLCASSVQQLQETCLPREIKHQNGTCLVLKSYSSTIWAYETVVKWTSDLENLLFLCFCFGWKSKLHRLSYRGRR